MANLTIPSNPSSFPEVYQLERTDLWDAGTSGNGIANQQAKQLAERDQWLKVRVDQLIDQGIYVKGFGTDVTSIPAGDLGKIIGYATDGGAVTATLPATSAGNVGKIIALEHFENGGLFTPMGLTIQRAGSNLIFYNGVSSNSLRLDAGDILVLVMDSATSWRVMHWHRRSSLNPAGAVMAFARSSAPLGWLKANGQAVSRTTYAELFALIGTTYGAGNGTTTFNLPDLRAEFIRGWDDGRNIDPSRTLGSAQRGTLIAVDPDGATNAYVAQYQSVAMGANDGPLAASRMGVDLDTDGATNYPNTTTAWVATSNLSNFLYGVARPRNVAMLYCIKY